MQAMFSTGIGFGDYAARNDAQKLFFSFMSLWCLSLLTTFLYVIVDEMLWRSHVQADQSMSQRIDDIRKKISKKKAATKKLGDRDSFRLSRSFDGAEMY